MVLAERVAGADGGAKKKMDELVESIEDIVRTREDEIDELDQVCWSLKNLRAKRH